LNFIDIVNCNTRHPIASCAAAIVHSSSRRVHLKKRPSSPRKSAALSGHLSALAEKIENPSHPRAFILDSKFTLNFEIGKRPDLPSLAI
jgi:hypothetical protein